MNFHILDQADDRKTVNMILHIPIPSENNVVGINLQTALVAYLGGQDAITSRVADASELAQMKAGSIFEMQVAFQFKSTEPEYTDTEKLADIQSYYAGQVNEIQNIARNRLAYWGFAANI